MTLRLIIAALVSVATIGCVFWLLFHPVELLWLAGAVMLSVLFMAVFSGLYHVLFGDQR